MIQIVPLTAQYFEQVIALASEVHGDNYLDLEKLKAMQLKASKDNLNANFIALEGDNLVGLRLSYSPGNWPLDKWCTPESWPCKASEMAYFKCIAIDPTQQGNGIGPKLLSASIDTLKLQGAKAGVAHLWRQSPGNGAVKYFKKCGGKLIKEHPNRWRENSINDGYVCPVCTELCECSAAEMVIEF